MARRWELFLKKLDSRPADVYEGVRPGAWPFLEIYHGEGYPRRLFLFTNDYLCREWLLHGYRRNWSAFVRYGLTPPSYLATIQLQAEALRLPLHFVGDLDPHDLTVFAALRCGDPYFRRTRGSLQVKYLGVDDWWLDHCMRHLGSVASWEMLTPPMGQLEREHFELACELLPDMKQLIGPRCFELLSSGRTFPLPAASNPEFYDAEFLKKLEEHLFRARGH